MTTKKKLNDRIKNVVEEAKNDLFDSNTTSTSGYCHTEYIDPDKTKNEMTVTTNTDDDEDDGTFRFCWDDNPIAEKRKLAQDILVRLIDFNLEQLSRTDVDKVLIYDNPAEYAAEVVNELYERIKE